MRFLLTIAVACFAVNLASAEEVLTASADLKGSDGKSLGVATLLELKDKVVVTINISKLARGKHGVHFHENGTCDSPDFLTAGAHFNPLNKEHGLSNPKGAHGGDLMNLDVADDGTANLQLETDRVTLRPGPTSLLKKGSTSLVIHEKADDQKTNPSGNSGKRIACGIIVKR